MIPSGRQTERRYELLLPTLLVATGAPGNDQLDLPAYINEVCKRIDAMESCILLLSQIEHGRGCEGITDQSLLRFASIDLITIST